MKSIILAVSVVFFSSCSSISSENRQGRRTLAGMVSISNKTCAVEGQNLKHIRCKLSKDDANESTVGLSFPNSYFAEMPSCVFQAFGNQKPRKGKIELNPKIILVSSSEVKIGVSNALVELFTGDLAFSFICIE